jgi:hypothetical protein
MALQHELRVTGARIPELDAAVLGARHDPLAIGRQSDAEDKVLWVAIRVSVYFKPRENEAVVRYEGKGERSLLKHLRDDHRKS